MNIIKLYKETEDKEHREWFLLICIIILGLIGIISITYIAENGSSSYYRAHSGLFILDLMAFLMFVGTKAKTKEILSKAKRLFNKEMTPNLFDYGDILLIVAYLMAITSFIFILDLSFIENYGIRISAVVAVTIVKMLRDLSRRKS